MKYLPVSHPDHIALLIIDPYNDFITEGGKIWNRISGVAEANNCVRNMLQVVNAARKAGLRIFYALHHHIVPAIMRSDVEMHAAFEINIPNYASAIVSTAEIIETFSSL